LRRSYSDTIGFLRSFLDEASSLPAVERDRYLERLADLQRLSGDVANAKKNYAQARNELEQRLKEQPDDDGILSSLAKVSAGLGDSQLAMKYIESAISLMPASKDAWGGPEHEERRARIAARFGMKDIAIPALERLLKTSYWSPLTPALLRLDPDFDSLRSDPRFQKLCEEKQP
jgi:tetratricopeptide (TPR) repeat protein